MDAFTIDPYKRNISEARKYSGQFTKYRTQYESGTTVWENPETNETVMITRKQVLFWQARDLESNLGSYLDKRAALYPKNDNPNDQELNRRYRIYMKACKRYTRRFKGINVR